MLVSLRETQSTPTTTSSRPSPSSLPSAVRLTLQARPSTRHASVNLPPSLPTGVRRPERETPAMESSGPRPSTGCRRSAAMALTTHHATTRPLAGRQMRGLPSAASSTSAVVPSSYLGTTTTVCFPTSLPPARTTARTTCLRTPTWCTLMASWPWQLVSGST